MGNLVDLVGKLYGDITEKEVYAERGRQEVQKKFKKYYRVGIVEEEDVDREGYGGLNVNKEESKKQGMWLLKREGDMEIWGVVDIFEEAKLKCLRETRKREGYTEVEIKYIPLYIREELERGIEEGVKRKEKKEEQRERKEENLTVVEWVDNVLNEGINRGASDIHIEPKKGGLRVRLRLDGLLHTVESKDVTDQEIEEIVGRIKIMSNMDIAERRKAQDGRIGGYISKRGTEYDMRVSTVLTQRGEKFVLRLVDKTSSEVEYEDLGFTKEQAEALRRVLKKPNGTIYVVGATGSGKTTTLYGMIRDLNTEEKNTYTIENPIEREIEGVNQIEVNEKAGVTYAETLRALMRQDPDVLVVGEIRDKETAEVATQAALTGHMVLTTLHANNALDGFSRLMDLDIDVYILGVSTLMILSQRLVRVLCPKCKKKRGIGREEVEGLVSILGEGVREVEEVYDAVGCEECLGIGYRGRVGVVEQIEVTEEIQKALSLRDRERVQEEARKGGYREFRESSVELLRRGETSIAEVIRTTL